MHGEWCFIGAASPLPPKFTSCLIGKIPLEEEMATYSSILAWRILWTEEPGGLQCMGSQSWTQLSIVFVCLPAGELWVWLLHRSLMKPSIDQPP